MELQRFTSRGTGASMTNDGIALTELLQKSDENDFLRALAGAIDVLRGFRYAGSASSNLATGL